jgi:hypothetical protein
LEEGPGVAAPVLLTPLEVLMFASLDSLSSRVPGVRLEDLVAVPVDVGKHVAMAKVIDFRGSELAGPFEFCLDRSGVERLVARVRSVMPESVMLVRVGLEAAGHYHLPLAGVCCRRIGNCGFSTRGTSRCSAR